MNVQFQWILETWLMSNESAETRWNIRWRTKRSWQVVAEKIWKYWPPPETKMDRILVGYHSVPTVWLTRAFRWGLSLSLSLSLFCWEVGVAACIGPCRSLWVLDVVIRHMDANVACRMSLFFFFNLFLLFFNIGLKPFSDVSIGRIISIIRFSRWIGNVFPYFYFLENYLRGERREEGALLWGP